MNTRFRPLLALTVICLVPLGCQKAQTPADNPSDRSASPGMSTSAPASPGSAPIQAPIAAPGSGGSGDASQDLEEKQMLILINQHRSDTGYAPLQINSLLIHSARWLSQDMASRSYLSHTDSLGRDSFERMDAFGFDLNGWRGENIACGNADATATYYQWLNSPGHNANMLGTHYTKIGIARAYDSSSQYGWYWTTDFGTNE